MTIYEFVNEYTKKNPDGHWFDRQTLKFFGERLSDMHVFESQRVMYDWSGALTVCYVVSHKGNGYHGRKYTYFDAETMDDIGTAYDSRYIMTRFMKGVQNGND